MSEDSGRRRRASDDDDARPVTAAGRRRRADGDGRANGRGEASGNGPGNGRDGGRGDGGSDGDGSTATRTVRRSTTATKGAATPTREQARSTSSESVFARLRRFLREVVAELRKVHWPTRRQIVVYTFVVLVFVAFMVALVAGLDWVFARD